MANGYRDSGYPRIAATANNISSDSIDCGIAKLGWCRGARCQQYASLKWFVIILSVAGVLQGASISYFRISAKQAALFYGYDPVMVDWLLVSSGIFQAIFALGFAHLAHKYHPISWLGGITVLQGVTCILAIIPSITILSHGLGIIIQPNDFLCSTSAELSRLSLDEDQSRSGTLILLFALQFAIGMGNLAYIIIGVTYLDDNSQSVDSPAAIGLVLSATFVGLQFGYFITMILTILSASWWVGWIVLGPLIFIAGSLLALFPRRLVKTVLHQTAQRIIEESTLRNFGSRMSAYIDDTDFMPSLRRLFTNKLLLTNAIGLMFILGAILNYFGQEESYLQSRFYIPFNEEDGLMDEWNQRFISYFLMPPCAATAVLITGLIISKTKLSARTITMVNVILGLALVGIFVGLVFVKCNVGSIAGFSNNKLVQPYCSRQCICTPTTFFPICPENSTITYFSPCYAGCNTRTLINNVALYEYCTCGADHETAWRQIRATEGACNQKQCQSMWILFQALSLLVVSLLAQTLIGKIIITFRSVLPQDKAAAVALNIMFVGLFTFLPAKFGYHAISNKTCIHWSQNYSECLLRQTPLHGNILNIVTAGLILFGVLFDIIVFSFVKDLNVYNCKVTDPDYNPVLVSETNNHVPETTAYVPVPDNVSESVSQPRPLRQLRPAPKSFVFRSPSSVTESSTETSNQEPASNGVTYSQLVFPSTTRGPKEINQLDMQRNVTKPNVPLHNLSEHDVRKQLGNLKSFSSAEEHVSSDGSQSPLSESRPKSPETAL